MAKKFITCITGLVCICCLCSIAYGLFNGDADTDENSPITKPSQISTKTDRPIDIQATASITPRPTDTTTVEPTATITSNVLRMPLIPNNITAIPPIPYISEAECIPKDTTREVGEVVGIIDGDTIEVRLQDGNIYKVRYIGMDTPEKGEHLFGETSKMNQDMVYLKTVTLVKDVSEVDQYDRFLRYVLVGETFC